MAKILIGNIKPVKGRDYLTPADMEELGETFAKKDEIPDITAVQEDVENLEDSVAEIQEAVSGAEGKFAPAYTYGTEDLEAGVTPLETGKLHFVYE